MTSALARQARDMLPLNGTNNHSVSTAHHDPMTHARARKRKEEIEIEKKLTVLYRRYSHRVYRRALKLLRDTEDARDVMQDTFLAFFHSEKAWRGEAAPFTLLYQIATHKAMDRLRRRARWFGTLDSQGFMNEAGVEHRLGLATVHGGDMVRVDALNHLTVLTLHESSRARIAAVLYFVEGYTMGQIGEALQLPPRKASRLLRKFVERVRKRAIHIESRMEEINISSGQGW
jgi:RNA polymerase sigma-70 factor (ECF subfamily)